MTLRITIPARIYCDNCSKYFEIEIPATLAPRTQGDKVELQLHEVEPPKGWYFKMYWKAFCPDHHPNN